MNKHTHLIAVIGLFLVSFLSSSCFDIVEEYYISADGSGSMKITMDMQELGEMIKSLGEMDEEGGENPMGEFDEVFGGGEMAMALQQLDGIHNVQDLSDPDNYLISYKFDFDEVAVINDLMGEGNGFSDMLGMPFGDESAESNNEPREMILKGKKFTTKGSSKMPEPKTDEEEGEMGMAMAMLQDATYKVVYTFERDVKKVKKNDNATIGPDGRTVVIKSSMADLLTGDSDFNSQIKLK